MQEGNKAENRLNNENGDINNRMTSLLFFYLKNKSK